MIILAIESSCDETAAAILKDDELLSNVVVSQIDIFKEYGGVIPEVAARSHLEAILPVIDKAMNDAKVTWDDIDDIAVTHTPGLLGSLLIGTLTARTLAIVHDKPLYAVHHLKSHIYSNWLRKVDAASGETVLSPSASAGYGRGSASATPATAGGRDLRPTEQAVDRKRANLPSFPLLSLVISGGHTQIIYMKAHNSFEIIGTTLDDAVGECFDKVAKILGLPYPGGPSVAKAAENGNPDKYEFPHPKIDGLNFSFSGLKTAVLRRVQKECGVDINYPSHDLKNLLTPEQVADFAASFQKTAIDILLEKLATARSEHPEVKSIVFAGGVSANKALRGAATALITDNCDSKPSFESHKRNPRNLRGEREGEQSMAGVSRIALRAARPGDEEITTEFSCAKKNGFVEQSTNSKSASPSIYFPSPEFSSDNAAMVAMACYYEIQSGVKPTDPYKLTLAPRSNLC